tara:strand:- start:99 stop:242 length:144 start_codon:yes stop_codon:yes gene_type:complete
VASVVVVRLAVSRPVDAQLSVVARLVVRLVARLAPEAKASAVWAVSC